MKYELCEICRFRRLFVPGDEHVRCAEREDDCPGFMPGNLKKMLTLIPADADDILPSLGEADRITVVADSEGTRILEDRV